jgi:hypothetical protein
MVARNRNFFIARWRNDWLYLTVVLQKFGFECFIVPPPNLCGGCLLPVIAGLLATYYFNRLIPDDPCDGAFTPDSYFVFEVIFPLTTLSAIVVFFAMASRR